MSGRVYKLLREALPTSRHPLQAAAGALLPAERSGRGALLVRAARLDQRHLRRLQRQRPGARGDRPRQRPQQLAPRPADQAVGARRLPRPLPALPIDNLPSAGELQLLVPAATAAGAHRRATPPTDLDEARDSLASTVASRRAQRTALWQDSSRFQDSFFAPDSRQDGFSVQRISAPAAGRRSRRRGRARTGTHSQPGDLDDNGRDGEDGGAVVVDPGTGIALAIAPLSRRAARRIR
jgi:hypothetical protein